MIEVGPAAWRLLYTDEAIWVPDTINGTVVRIDTASQKVTHAIEVGEEPHLLAAVDDAIWVTDLAEDTLIRIKTR